MIRKASMQREMGQRVIALHSLFLLLSLPAWGRDPAVPREFQKLHAWRLNG